MEPTVHKSNRTARLRRYAEGPAQRVVPIRLVDVPPRAQLDHPADRASEADANADADARHVVLDPNQSTRFGGCGLQLADEAGIAEMLEFHEEASEIALPRFLAEERRFDLAFVDGNHRFDGVFLDLIYLGRLLRPGGILFVDDYQLPAVARAASFCLTNLGWTLEEVSADDDLHHWAVLRTSGIPDARPFDDYVDF